MLNSGSRDDRPRIALKIGGMVIALGMIAPPDALARQDDPSTGTGSGQATERPKTKHKITIKAEIEIETIPADAAKTAERPTTRSLIAPKPGLPRDTSKLRLGIVKHPACLPPRRFSTKIGVVLRWYRATWSSARSRRSKRT